MNAQARPHRGTIFEERAEVLAHERFAGDQFVLTLQAPKCARAAKPGSFVHLSCDEQVPMRRPLSIMRAHPERGSIHSFGMAVDLTLLDPAGRQVDMGSGFDEMTLASHPDHEAEHLALGVLKPEHLVERGWLRAAMREAGFHGIATEWWHFDFGDRVAVRRDLPRVL